MFADRLPYDDFVPYAPEDIDAAVIVRHQDCDNGVDHKARLWIKRNENGSIVARCHNCQRKGYYRDKEYHRPLSVLLNSGTCRPTTVSTDLQLPDDATTELKEWPAAAKVWLYKARLTDEQIELYQFSWSKYYGRVIIPVYSNVTGELIFWQGRSLDTTINPPKYISASRTKDDVLFYGSDDNGDTVVIVEDVLSAVRVAEYMPSACTMGVSFTFKQTLEIARNFKKAVIFLDDDNPTVKSSQLKLMRDLLSLMDSVVVHHSKGIDPKEYSRDELKEVLKNYK